VVETEGGEGAGDVPFLSRGAALHSRPHGLASSDRTLEKWYFASLPAAMSLYDVVVVGGGVSGLTAANTLRSAGKRVLVLEARDVRGAFWYLR